MARRRPKQKSEDGSSDRWLSTYGDAVTLLLAFFVILFSMSEVRADKFRAMAEGLADALGTGGGNQVGVLDNGSSLMGSANPQSGMDPLAVGGTGLSTNLPPLQPIADVPAPNSARPASWLVQPEIGTTEVANPATEGDPGRVAPPGAGGATSGPNDAGAPVTDAGRDDGDEVLGQQVELLPEHLEALEAEVRQYLMDLGLDTVVGLQRDDRGLVVVVSSDDVLFATGDSTLTPRGAQIVEQLAPVLARYSNPVLVEGHTDDVPLQSATTTNWNLSVERAASVVNSLIRDHGIRPQRLTALGRGEYEPRADNGTAEGRAANRRVEMTIEVTRRTGPVAS